jgi:hypothetical protein
MPGSNPGPGRSQPRRVAGTVARPNAAATHNAQRLSWDMADLQRYPAERDRPRWLLPLLVGWIAALLVGMGAAFLIWTAVSSWTLNLSGPGHIAEPTTSPTQKAPPDVPDSRQGERGQR